MGLTRHDAIATALTAGVVALYVPFLAGASLPLVSGPRALGLAVIVLGIAGCAAGGGIAADEAGRYARTFFTIAAVLGLVAFVAGLATLATGSEVLLAVLVCAVVALWALATVRHATALRPVNASGTRTGHLVS